MRSQFAFIAASFVIHAAVVSPTGNQVLAKIALHPSVSFQKKLPRVGPREIQLEFVESPAQKVPRKPIRPRKISDKNSVAQDKTLNKESARPQDAPKVEREGPSDQLQQIKLPPVKPDLESPSQGARPVEEKPKAEDTKQQSDFGSKPNPDKAEPEPEKAASGQDQPESAPSPVLAQVSADRINTQLSSMANSRGAQLYGTTSFEATGSGMGQYMKNMKERIWLAWFPYIAYQYPKDFKSADAVLEFKLSAQGESRDIKIVYEKGSPLFAVFCAESLKRAGNFGPLPEEFLKISGKDEIEIKFAFHYW